MRLAKHYALSKRDCPLCGAPDSEFLYDIVQRTVGLKFDHFLQDKISICRRCGFLFASPSIQQNDWNAYYNDSLPFFNPEEDYSVEKRVHFLLEYWGEKKGIVAELGGNTQGRFREALENIFDGYYSFDVNSNCENTSSAIEFIPVVDVLVSYYVFEHLVDLNELLQEYRKHLSNGGIFIIEVPDATMYYRDTTCLAVAEHVNHFTPQSLSALMYIHGFDLLGFSRQYASRQYGFVAAYKKSSCINENSAIMPQAYEINRSLIMEGLEIINQYQVNLEHTCERIHKLISENDSRGRATAFWCAGEFFDKLYSVYIDKYRLLQALIIDEDPQKKKLGLEYNIVNSIEVFEAQKRQEVKSIIVCSHTRLQSVIATVKKYRSVDTVDFFIITPDYRLELIAKK